MGNETQTYPRKSNPKKVRAFSTSPLHVLTMYFSTLPLGSNPVAAHFGDTHISTPRGFSFDLNIQLIDFEIILSFPKALVEIVEMLFKTPPIETTFQQLYLALKG